MDDSSPNPTLSAPQGSSHGLIAKGLYLLWQLTTRRASQGNDYELMLEGYLRYLRQFPDSVVVKAIQDWPDSGPGGKFWPSANELGSSCRRIMDESRDREKARKTGGYRIVEPAGRDANGTYRAALVEKIDSDVSNREVDVAAAYRCIENLRADPELLAWWTDRLGRAPCVQDFTRFLGIAPPRKARLTPADLRAWMAGQSQRQLVRNV